MPNLVTARRLRERMHYDPLTGHFTWRSLPGAWRGWNEKCAGKRAGCESRGYWLIRLEGRVYKASRLAWLYMSGHLPVGHIDHINGHASDDRFSNLRSASPSENSCNRKLQSNNSSGFKGVNWLKANHKWRARVQINGTSHHLGLYDDPVAAALAYDRAAEKMHGEYAKPNRALGTV